MHDSWRCVIKRHLISGKQDGQSPSSISHLTRRLSRFNWGRKSKKRAIEPPNTNQRETTNANSLTITVISHPLVDWLQTRNLPKPFHAGLRVLVALLNLDALKGRDAVAQYLDVADGRDRGSVTAAFRVVYILADDLPVGEVEDFLAVDPVCVGEAVEDESAGVFNVIKQFGFIG